MDTPIVSLKRCSRCLKFKDPTPDNFYRNKNLKDGLTNACKECLNNKVQRLRIVDGCKQCSRCKEWLKITAENFPPDAGNTTTGLSSQCRKCSRKTQHEYNERHPEAITIATKKYNAKKPNRQAGYAHEYREHYPEKAKAHDIVHDRIKRGLIPSPLTLVCEHCGKQAQHYHHADYSKPLEVIALCNRCHKKLHRMDA